MVTQNLGRLPTPVGEFVNALRARCALQAAILFGSQARGDADHFSDFDLFVIADDLPRDWWRRSELLSRDQPAGVDVIGYTPGEIRANLHRPLILDVALEGIAVYGEMGWLRALAQTYIAERRLVKCDWGYRQLEPV
jgi:hypothetical protein